MGPERTLATWFWARVDRSAGPDACWPWLGGHDRGGYGTLRPGGRARVKWLAHRFAWWLTNGRLPRSLNVLHSCDNPPCVNPAHLFLGTQADNLADMIAKGRGFRPAGALHPRARLTSADIAAIRAADVSAYGARAELARRYGVNRGHLSAILNGHRWQSAEGA